MKVETNMPLPLMAGFRGIMFIVEMQKLTGRRKAEVLGELRNLLSDVNARFAKIGDIAPQMDHFLSDLRNVVSHFGDLLLKESIRIPEDAKSSDDPAENIAEHAHSVEARG